MILDEDDCLQCGGIPIHQVRLSGAYRGLFPVYLVDVSIPALAFDDSVPVVGVSSVPRGFDGIACFKFLRRFSYGNFGNPDGLGFDPVLKADEDLWLRFLTCNFNVSFAFKLQ